MENKTEAASNPTRETLHLVIAGIIGFIICLLLVQSFMMFYLFTKIDDLETRLQREVDRNNDIIIQYLKK